MFAAVSVAVFVVAERLVSCKGSAWPSVLGAALHEGREVASRFSFCCCCPYMPSQDLNNEPHGRATWGDNNLATDWRLGAERIAAVVQEANPRLLIFVEGVESACGEHSWWGGCFTAAPQAPVRLPIENKLVYR